MHSCEQTLGPEYFRQGCVLGEVRDYRLAHISLAVPAGTREFPPDRRRIWLRPTAMVHMAPKLFLSAALPKRAT